jgi:GNAT superfamily N-acetyltransferase
MFQIKPANKDNFKDIPSPCRHCLYWQTSGDHGKEMLKPENEKQKREWLGKVKKGFGNCIGIAYQDGVPIGFVQYAPAKFFPRVKEYISGQPGEEAVVLACLYITDEEARGKGFGTRMLKDLVVELRKRGAKAIETYARRSSENNPSGPLRFYLKKGFKFENEKDDFPLARLEL